MKKAAVLSALLSLLTATSALAEHKLLVTDVPDKGQIETRLDYVYSKAEGKNDVGVKVKDELSGAVASFGVGLGEGLKLSATIPYTFEQHTFEGGKIDGVNDLILGARYAFTKSLVKLPFDAAFGIDWKLNSADSGTHDAGTGTNIYAPYLAVSKNLETFIPYLKYQPAFTVKEGRDQTIHNITVGSEIEICHHASLDLAVTASANQSHKDMKSSTDVEFEVVPYINLSKNLYLLPKAAYKIIGDQEKTTGERLTNIDEYTLGMGIYYLF